MRLIIYFFTNQIIYRRRGARISGKSMQGFNYEKFPTSSAEVLTKHHLPLLSPRLPSSVTAAATGISRTDHGAFTVRKSQPPPSRNPRSGSWSRFSWRNVWLLHYEKHNTVQHFIMYGDVNTCNSCMWHSPERVSLVAGECKIPVGTA